MSMNSVGRSYKPQNTTRMRIIAAVIVAATLALALFSIYGIFSHDDAYADVYVITQEPEADDSGDDQATGSETIEDNDTPLAASASKSGSSESGFNFELLIVAGIVAVIAFFGAWIIRLNVNMKQMSASMRSKKRLE